MRKITRAKNMKMMDSLMIMTSGADCTAVMNLKKRKPKTKERRAKLTFTSIIISLFDFKQQIILIFYSLNIFY